MQLHFKFNPSLSRELAADDRRLWLLRSVALRIERQANPLWRFEIYHRRLLVALATLAVAGWILAASGLFFWLNRQPHNQVGWFDLAAPWRWSGLRAKRGDTAILAALDELKERDYTSAFYNLRVGLDRSPGNVEGRLMLARMLAGHDPARAVTLLEEGLPYAGNDPKLIAGLLGVYGLYQMNTHGLAVVDGLLGDKRPLSPEARRLLENGRAGFLIELGRQPEAAAALASAAGSPSRPGGPSLEAAYQLRLGRPAEARKILEPLLAAPNAEPALWRQAVDVAVALGDADGLTSALRHLRAAAPEQPAAYLIAFKAWHQMNRPGLRDGAEQDYYRVFRNNDGALQAFAAQAVLLDLPDVLARAQRMAAANKLSQFAFRVHRTELALRRGEIETATRLLREWENDVDTLKAAQRFHPEFIKRLTRAAFAGTADQVAFLTAHLAAARGLAQLPNYELAATVLEKAGNPAGAAEVVRAGLQVYPQSDPLLMAQTHLAGVAVASAPAESTKSPGPALLLLPDTAAEAGQQLGELLRKESWGAARDLMRAIRSQKPAWLPAIEPELAVREVELAYLTLDQIASRTATRAFLDRRRGEADVLALVALIPRLAARGQTAEARLLFDEIKAAPSANARVQQALRDLNLAADATATMTQEAVLSALDGHIRAQRWAEADRVLKQLRDDPPAWLAAATSEVRAREVQVKLGLDQRPLALAVLKELVVKSGAPRSAAFKLVRDLIARGENESALLLAREISRLLPDDPAVPRLLREAEAAPLANP